MTRTKRTRTRIWNNKKMFGREGLIVWTPQMAVYRFIMIRNSQTFQNVASRGLCCQLCLPISTTAIERVFGKLGQCENHRTVLWIINCTTLVSLRADKLIKRLRKSTVISCWLSALMSFSQMWFVEGYEYMYVQQTLATNIISTSSCKKPILHNTNYILMILHKW